MSDALAALSIIFSMITALYIQWSGEIQKALDLPIKDYLEDRNTEQESVERTIKKYARPIVIASTSLSVVIVPEWCKIVWTTIFTIYTYKLSVFTTVHYNIVNACFILLGLLSFSLTVYTSISFTQLIQKKKKLLKK